MVESAGAALSTASPAGAAPAAAPATGAPAPVTTLYAPGQSGTRSDALKALLKSHISENGGNTPTLPSERVAALKTLLQEHISANGGTPPESTLEVAALPANAPPTDAAHSILLDLSRYVQEDGNLASVKLKLSDPQAGSLTAPVTDSVTFSADNKTGVLLLQGESDALHDLLSNLRLIPGRDPASFRLDVIVEADNRSTHHFVPMIFDQPDGRYIPLRPISEIHSFGRAQLPDLDIESNLFDSFGENSFSFASRLLEHTPPLYALSDRLASGSVLNNSRGLDNIEIGSSLDIGSGGGSGGGNAGGNGGGNSGGGNGSIPPVLTPDGGTPPINLAPFAQANHYTDYAGVKQYFFLTDSNGTGLLDNDSDPEGDVISFVGIDSVTLQGGTINVLPNGKFVYTPPNGFLGADNAHYTISDGQGNLSQGLVVFISDGAILLTPSPTDFLIGGSAFSGIASNWQSTDSVEGNGSHSLTLTSGMVTVDLTTYDLVSGVRSFILQGDAAHSFTFSADYLSRSAISGSLSVSSEATSFGVNLDAGALDATGDIALSALGSGNTLIGGDGDDTLSGHAGDTLTGGAGDDQAIILSGTLADTLNGASNIGGIESLDLTGSDAAHDITVQDAYFAGLDDTTLAIDISGLSSSIQIDASALSSSYGVAITAGNGNSTLQGGAGADSLSFAEQTAGLNIDLSADSATQGATSYDISGFETVTGSAFSDTIRGSLADELLQGGGGDDHIHASTASSDYAFSNLVMHLDATNAGSITLATGVSQWNDLSGYGNDATQGTAGNQPANGGDISGQNAIVFDGTNDYFGVADTSDINTSSQNERSVFVQFETGADVTTRQVIYEQGGGSNGFGIYIIGGQLYVGAWKSSGASFGLFLSGAVAANTEYSAGFVFDFPGNEFRGYLDGNLLGTLAVPQSQGGHSGDIGIGALNNASYFHDIGADNGSTGYFFQGAISEVLNYAYALTEVEQASLANYLASKYIASGNGDTLSGGEGADNFYWSDTNTATATRADHISDFSSAEGDKINLTDTSASAFYLTGNTALSGIAGEVAWQQDGSDTRIQLDRDGDGTADLEIVLDGINASDLSRDDFTLPDMSLSGSASDESLYGGIGNDTISGGLGDDTIYGGAGNDEIYGGSSGSYTPNDGAFWLDPSNAGSLTLSGGVQQIDDLFGSTNDASQGSAGARPQIQAAGLNGLNTMLFDGTNDILTLSSAADINTSNQSERTVFLTFETSADITSRQYLYEQGGSTNGFSIYIYNGEVYVAAWRSGGSDINHFLHTTIDANTAYTVGFVFDYGTTNTFSGYLNGTMFDSGTVTMEQSSHSDAMGIGGINGGTLSESGSASGSYFNGEIGEIVNFDRALDAAERQNLEAYLSTKWGTPFNGSTTDDDVLVGGLGNDTITGGAGQDTMTGGEGNDIFAFLDLEDSTTANPDVITDFTQGQDKLDVSALGFTAASDFTITNDGTTTTVDDGAGFTITLNGALVLTDSDFLF